MKLCITILKYHSLVVFMPTQITTNHAITYNIQTVRAVTKLSKT